MIINLYLKLLSDKIFTAEFLNIIKNFVKLNKYELNEQSWLYFRELVDKYILIGTKSLDEYVEFIIKNYKQENSLNKFFNMYFEYASYKESLTLLENLNINEKYFINYSNKIPSLDNENNNIYEIYKLLYEFNDNIYDNKKYEELHSFMNYKIYYDQENTYKLKITLDDLNGMYFMDQISNIYSIKYIYETLYKCLNTEYESKIVNKTLYINSNYKLNEKNNVYTNYIIKQIINGNNKVIYEINSKSIDNINNIMYIIIYYDYSIKISTQFNVYNSNEVDISDILPSLIYYFEYFVYSIYQNYYSNIHNKNEILLYNMKKDIDKSPLDKNKKDYLNSQLNKYSNKTIINFNQNLVGNYFENSIIIVKKAEINNIYSKLKDNLYISKNECKILIDRLFSDNSLSYKVIKMMKINNRCFNHNIVNIILQDTRTYATSKAVFKAIEYLLQESSQLVFIHLSTNLLSPALMPTLCANKYGSVVLNAILNRDTLNNYFYQFKRIITDPYLYPLCLEVYNFSNLIKNCIRAGIFSKIEELREEKSTLGFMKFIRNNLIKFYEDIILCEILLALFDCLDTKYVELYIALIVKNLMRYLNNVKGINLVKIILSKHSSSQYTISLEHNILAQFGLIATGTYSSFLIEYIISMNTPFGDSLRRYLCSQDYPPFLVPMDFVRMLNLKGGNYVYKKLLPLLDYQLAYHLINKLTYLSKVFYNHISNQGWEFLQSYLFVLNKLLYLQKYDTEYVEFLCKKLKCIKTEPYSSYKNDTDSNYQNEFIDYSYNFSNKQNKIYGNSNQKFISNSNAKNSNYNHYSIDDYNYYDNNNYQYFDTHNYSTDYYQKHNINNETNYKDNQYNYSQTHYNQVNQLKSYNKPNIYHNQNLNYSGNKNQINHFNDDVSNKIINKILPMSNDNISILSNSQFNLHNFIEKLGSHQQDNDNFQEVKNLKSNKNIENNSNDKDEEFNQSIDETQRQHYKFNNYYYENSIDRTKIKNESKNSFDKNIDNVFKIQSNIQSRCNSHRLSRASIDLPSNIENNNTNNILQNRRFSAVSSNNDKIYNVDGSSYKSSKSEDKFNYK